MGKIKNIILDVGNILVEARPEYEEILAKNADPCDRYICRSGK